MKDNLTLEETAPVLYADDDENDVYLMERTFAKLDILRPLEVVNDGTQAIEYLRSVADGEKPAPCVAILDLKMPLVNGLEVLRWAREQPPLAKLPIIIFTSSAQMRDVREAYESGANAYLVKPADPDRLREIIGQVRDACLACPCTERWLNIPENVPVPSS